jgi:hypothetical protein
MFPFTSALSYQTALFRHGVQFISLKYVGKYKWNKCIIKIEYNKIFKKSLINKSVE